MGHRDLLVTKTYLNPQATTARFASCVASAAGRLRSNALTGNMGTGTNFSGKATFPESVAQSLACIQARRSLGGSGKYSGGIGKRPECKQTTLHIVEAGISSLS